MKKDVNELLKAAIEQGIIDLDVVQQDVEVLERKKYLSMHKYTISYNEKDKFYRTYLPDDEKGRRQIKRRSEKDLLDVVVEYYKASYEKEKDNKESKKITLEEIFPKWLKHKQIHTRSTSYIKRITTDWTRFYVKEDKLIHTPLKELTKLYLDEWVHRIIKENNLDSKCYYNMSIIIRQCLEYAVECGYIEENVFEKVKVNTKLFVKKKKKPSETQVYSYQEEINLVNDMIRRFKNNPKSTAPLMVILAFELGVRIGELCALKFSDVEGDYIQIQRQEVYTYRNDTDITMVFDGYQIVDYTKSEDGYRQIYLTNNARKIIEIARIMNEANYEKNIDNFIFCKDGKNINHYSVMAMIKRGCEYINMAVKTSHKIRKSVISTLIDEGLNIDEVRRIAGHSDERTTLGNYCFNRLTCNETEDKIESALNSKKVIKGNQILDMLTEVETADLSQKWQK